MTRFVFGLALAGALTAQAADKINTAKGDLEVHPVRHGTVVFKWNGKTVFVDPVGGAAPFKPYGVPDLVLVTDIHMPGGPGGRDHIDGARRAPHPGSTRGVCTGRLRFCQAAAAGWPRNSA